MKSEMTISEAKRDFTKVLRHLKHPMTITRHGEPVAMIMSMSEYEKMGRMKTYHDILRIRKEFENCGVTATEAYQWVKQARRTR